MCPQGHRDIYGLKQARLVWWQTLAKSMVKEFGFMPINSDTSVYIYKGKDYVIAVVYIDDALFIGPNKSLVNKMKDKFMNQWECRDLGKPNEFLGICITRKGQSISIDQCTYLDKLLERCGMTDAKSATMPLPARYIPVPHTGSTGPELQERFQVVIGLLLYIMLGTRPNIAYAVTKLVQYSANPTKEHLNAALHICRYLAGTRDYRLCYDGKSKLGLVAYADSN
jgi:hypothetical protein